ncbi:MAG TPA: pitrilysin family protein [Allosphingosinicella sp.]|jgi:predicted Zn-dependent peptidase|nr:pitrilysin family protein [Allosphingosinicella sp.]
MRSVALASFLLAGLSLGTVAIAAPPANLPPPAPVSELVQDVNIPYQQFTLPNGLRVVVHEDHKAPVVAVSVWYHVGSKDEPPGKTGFAHLFEHLMFGGSEHSDQSWFTPMQQIGATDMNGTTWFDRTNYFETVPRGALETALFLESDRMGHLLGAVTQQKLDVQRGVVQNEKRQDDNEPYGLVEYSELNALFPEGHPYHHSTIGSMSDLDAASLETVKDWFRSHYGPNNAVLVLAGDIDLPTAHRLVEKYFGDIPRGPQSTPAAASVPTLPAPKSEEMHDQVATTRLYREWVVPGLTNADYPALQMGASILGGLSSSRLDNALVRGDKTAVSVSAGVEPFERISMFTVTVDVKPGVDPNQVATRLDAIIADFIRNGPTADEVQRAKTRTVSGRIKGLEQVGGFGGKAVALAEGAVYAGDPGFYKVQLQRVAALTPEQVRAVDSHWLSRPVYSLRVSPGPRGAYEESKSVPHGGIHAPNYFRAPAAGEHPLAPLPDRMGAPAVAPAQPQASGGGGVDRSHLPPVGQIADLRFPAVEHAHLSNGIEVIFAHRAAVPVVDVAVSFDAGNAADPKDKLGTQSLMLALLDEGTDRYSSVQIAEEEERLGASISPTAGMDRTNVTLSALRPNLAASVDLLADIVRRPAFAPAEVERLRGQQLARIQQEMAQPQGLALRTLPPMLYGKAHPYGVPFTGTGDPAVVAHVSRDEIAAFHDAWMRPSKAKIFVVGDTTLAEIMPMLERNFGDWRDAGPAPAKDFSAPIPANPPHIVLIDRPNSPQSLIIAGEVLDQNGRDDLVPLLEANDVLGGSFLSRLNMDLRETKHWAYGSFSFVQHVVGRVPLLVFAPVQSDQTGPSIASVIGDMHAFLTDKGVTPEELQRTINGSIRELPGSFETSGEVLGGMEQNEEFGRPDNYYETLASRYRGLTAADLDTVARHTIDPNKLVWVVVGDASKVKPQLDKLGIPVESVAAAH